MILIKLLHKDVHKLVDKRVVPGIEGLCRMVRRIKRMVTGMSRFHLHTSKNHRRTVLNEKNGLRSGEGGKWNLKPQPDENISYYAINLSTKWAEAGRKKKKDLKTSVRSPRITSVTPSTDKKFGSRKNQYQ